MTTGEIVKKKLGLEEFPIVKITRILGSGAIKVLMIFFDSYHPGYPINMYRLRKDRRVASVFKAGEVFQDPEKEVKYLPMTPLINLADYSGAIGGNVLLIPVDLSGDRFIDTSKFSNVIKESYVDLTEYSDFLKLTERNGDIIVEGITIKDLMKNQGLSDFTRWYSLERSRITGSETKATKLLDISLNKEEGWVQFDFLSEATNKYGDTYQYKEVDPLNNFSLKKNPSKTYTFMLRIEGFFDWLSTYGDNLKGKISGDDLKDILDVSDIKIFNTSPAYHWQGMNFNLSNTFDASIYPTNIPPTKWNMYKNKHDGSIHNGNQILDKGSQKILNQFYFYRNQMSAMLTKKLKKEGMI